MSDTHASHPSLEQLLAFDRGQLPPTQWAVIERHVAACAACCERLEGRPDDTFVHTLRAAASHLAVKPSSQAPPVARAADADAPAPLKGHPRYRVLQALGAGGMGVVYKAEHRLMERPVALKVIHHHLLARPGAVERFRLEVKAAARLAHPHIVTAYDAEQEDDVHFLVMEYVEGATLDHLLQQEGPFAVGRACELVRQAALGLQHAFDQGMVHRDIKPANLMLSPEGQVKILDFGLARFAREASATEALTGSGVVVGTPDYMAPEQALDPRQADIRADIYSLGCTLYHLLAGSAPFPEGAPLQKLMNHQERPPRPLAELRDDLPAGLEAVLERMLAKDPARRWQTPAEVAGALAPFCRGPSTSRPRHPSGGRWGRRWYALAAGAALLGTVLLGAGCWLALSLARHAPDEGEVAPAAAESPRPGGAEVRCYAGQSGPFTAVAFTGDGRRALTAGRDGALRLWDLDSGEEVARLEGHSQAVLSVAFSPDGKRALSGGRDGTVRAWDLAKLRPAGTFTEHQGAVHSVALLPDGRGALSGGVDGRVLLWGTERRRSIAAFQELGRVRVVAPSRKGRHAVSAGPDKKLRIWDLEGKKFAYRYEGHEGPVTSAVLSPDGRYLLSGSEDETLRLWRVVPEMALARLTGHAGPVLCVALAQADRRALSGGADRTVRLWDLNAGTETAQFTGHTGAVLAVAFTPDGRHALSGAADGTLRLWRLPPPVAHGARLEGHVGPVPCVALTPDGRLAASGGADQTVKLWDVAAGKERSTLRGHKAHVWGVALTPDGRTVASVGDDKTVRLWDVAGGKERKALQGHTDLVRCLALSPDGKLLATGSFDKTIRLWEVDSGKERGTLTGHSQTVMALAFSPDGKTLASATREYGPEGRALPGELKLWKVSTGEEHAPVEGLPGALFGLAFSPAGDLLATGGLDGTVSLWDVRAGKLAATLRGHGSTVHALAFAADGKTLTTGSTDRTVKVWDVAARKERQTLKGHMDEVIAVAISGDGRTVVSASVDQTVKVWKVAAGQAGP
jgi:WD40 repeat protein